MERDETATAAEQEHEPDNKIDIHLPSSGNVVVNVWGEARLGEFYRAVGDHKVRDGSVEGAMKKVLGTTPEKFTAQWRDYLRVELG